MSYDSDLAKHDINTKVKIIPDCYLWSYDNIKVKFNKWYRVTIKCDDRLYGAQAFDVLRRIPFDIQLSKNPDEIVSRQINYFYMWSKKDYSIEEISDKFLNKVLSRYTGIIEENVSLITKTTTLYILNHLNKQNKMYRSYIERAKSRLNQMYYDELWIERQ